MTTDSSYHHAWKEEIIMLKQKGDKKRFEVGVFVQVKAGGKLFGKISGKNGEQRWLVWLVGKDGKLEANDVEKTSRMISSSKDGSLPQMSRSFWGWRLRMMEALRLRLLAMTTRASQLIAETNRTFEQSWHGPL
jgi:hypothetical protein